MSKFSASQAALLAILALGGCGAALPGAKHETAHEAGDHADAAHGASHGDAHDAPAGDKHAADDAGHDRGHDAGHDAGHGGDHGGGHGDAHGAAPAAPAKEAHWDYASQHAWRDLSKDAAACAVGGRQSPINLYDQPAVDAPDLDFAYAGVEANFFNNGHTLQVAAPEGLAFNAGGKVFSLLQAHFHSPSEHRIDGESFGLEVHFVHKTPEGRLGVVGIVFREGRENPALGALFSKIPAKNGEANGVKVYFDPSAFLPAQRTYFQYDGSLTTPPCSEGVLWRVMREPIEASAAQIAAFKEAVGENARELQPLNGRLVSLGR
jgi:carbonic anhydrase